MSGKICEPCAALYIITMKVIHSLGAFWQMSNHSLSDTRAFVGVTFVGVTSDITIRRGHV